MSANKGLYGVNRGWELRRNIRYFASAASAITAVIYFLIGLNIISVLDTPSDQIFGFPAAIAYGLGALLLLRFDQRILWILGAVFQVFVIYMYFNLASQRSPAYEVWGILLRIPQLVVLILLTYLAVRWPLTQPTGTARS